MAKVSLQALLGNRVSPTGQYVSPAFRPSGGSAVVRPQRTLLDQQQLIQANNQSDISLQEQITNLHGQLLTINNGLEGIYTLLRIEFTEDKLRDVKERERTRRLTSNFRREESENQLESVERKISLGIERPIKTTQNKLGNLFDRIKNFFLTLGVGWLTNQGLEALEAAQDGAEDKLNEIKDNVIDKVTKVTSLIGGVWRGINRLIRAFTGFGKGLIGLVVKGGKLGFDFIKKLGKFGWKSLKTAWGLGTKKLPNLVKKFTTKGLSQSGNIFGKIFTKSGTQAGQAAAGKVGQKAGQKVGQKAAGGFFRFLPWIGSFFDWWDAGKAFMRGNNEAAGMYALGGIANLFPMVWTQALSAGFTGAGILSEVNEGYFLNDENQIDHLDFSKVYDKMKSIPALIDIPPEIIMVDEEDAAGAWNPGGATDSGTDVPAINSANEDNLYATTSKNLYNILE